MNPLIVKYLKFSGIAIGIITLLVVAWNVYLYFFTFHIVSTTPKSNTNVSSAESIINLKFNRELDSNKTKIIIPDGIKENHTISGSEITLHITEGVVASSSYQFDFNVTAKDGSTIPDYSFVLKTDDSTSITPAQEQLQLQQQDKADRSQLEPSDPVSNLLPHAGSNIYMEATYLTPSDTSDAKSVGIQVTISLTYDQQDDSAPAIAAAKAEALKYLTDNKINPDDYTITYQVQ